MTHSRIVRSSEALFEPAVVGAFRLANRIVMAPLTRNRALPDLSPGPFAADYYAQRASAGLIIAEATQVSARAQGYSATPGCYSSAQVHGWKKVTDAVHARGGTMVLQIWHTGRMSHTSFQEDGAPPVAPSAIRAKAKTFIVGQGFVDTSMPRALLLDEIAHIVADFRHAAIRAREAGFDGVEVHAGNGYLIDAFLRDGSNRRTDAYGGSVENRARLLLEVASACAKAIGADRLGVRISPVTTAGDSRDSDPQRLFNRVAAALSPLGLAYLHVIEGETGGARDSLPFNYDELRARFDGVYMANNGYDRAMALEAVGSGRVDLVSFGRLFMANPDLVERLKQDAPLNPLMGPETFYGGGAHGYSDYPTLEQSQAAKTREPA